MSPPVTSNRPRNAAWLLVLVYVLSIPGFAPAMVAELEAISSDHEVRVAFQNGHLDVVLHHDDNHHQHVHGTLTRLITGISAHNGDDDHVLHFADGSNVLGVSSTFFNVTAAAAAAACVPWHGVSFHPERPAREAIQRHAARPPPLVSMGMLCLRTTVLLV